MSMQTFSRRTVGFIPPMYWGGGADGDGRDMTGFSPTRTTEGVRGTISAPSFLDPYTGRGGEDLREQAIEFATPEEVLIAIEEDEELACHPVARPNGVRKAVVHVNGLRLEDFLEGKSGPIVAPPLSLRVRLRPVNGQEQRGGRRRRRRGGRGRGRGHAGNHRQ